MCFGRFTDPSPLQSHSRTASHEPTSHQLVCFRRVRTTPPKNHHRRPCRLVLPVGNVYVCVRHERDERGEFERIMQHSHSFMLLWVLQHEVSRGKGAIAEGLPFRAKEDRQVPRLFRGHGSRTARRVNCCFARCIISKTPRHRAAV